MYVRVRWWLQHTATHCNTLQHTATHCNTTLPQLPFPGAGRCRTDYLWHLCVSARMTTALQHIAKTNCNNTHCRVLLREPIVTFIYECYDDNVLDISYMNDDCNIHIWNITHTHCNTVKMIMFLIFHIWMLQSDDNVLPDHNSLIIILKLSARCQNALDNIICWEIFENSQLQCRVQRLGGLVWHMYTSYL